MTTQLSRVIYTDGSAPNNQNGCTIGGIGVAVFNQEGELLDSFNSRIEPSDGMTTTTNVRCEMLAVIKALELAKSSDIIHTDNQMIVKGYNEWLEGWKLKGWKNANKKPIANQDLWQHIDKLKQEKSQVTVKWVRGHSGIYGNELADSLATEAAA
ncbi:reverse transcriptase-like protein [Psychrosphaera sp. B3R10]|uniref:RNase H family protein n=1 Tax=unclassified Psychrosphaera TaxID=2641570 RepID=UPI001C097C73|nr:MULTISPECIES: RNase H family protein [unclassified Psychrosphaera]MBU2882266.1 reverse transcriptase-like protein [Psychrosphaera sp. I2R16]MBU2988947.1 reverse transcriptase-like protein [Psychrosphaera sp. B3R10]